VNTLLDAWLLTAQRPYLTKAEALIQRCVHPTDDVASRDLLNVEGRWSYTMFLSALARYLDVKKEGGEQDTGYAYGQASLLRYAAWMLENEEAYFEHPERLEYPTETWAAQEFRKANVFRLAAAHADEPLRSRLIQRGTEFAERAWNDLLRFPSRTVTRAAAIVMIEGPKDAFFRKHGPAIEPRVAVDCPFGPPEVFHSQKQRVFAGLKSFTGFGRALVRLLNPKRWWTLRHWLRP
jgi:hypothetical protein